MHQRKRSEEVRCKVWLSVLMRLLIEFVTVEEDRFDSSGNLRQFW